MDPNLEAALRAYVKSQPQKAECKHSPFPCFTKSATDSSCKIRPLLDKWLKRDRTFPFATHPVVSALAAVGCDPYRARMVVDREGFGMTVQDVEPDTNAFANLAAASKAILLPGVKICDQCKPPGNTFIYHSGSYSGACRRIAVSVEKYTLPTEGKVLCIGDEGNLRWCGKGDFLAVSHVWDHGWQGDSEKGLCSRVLEMLLGIAKCVGLE